MGWIRHHAIVVTGGDYDDSVAKAHEKAVELCEALVSPVLESKINGYLSFFVAPDGSKEGWEESDKGDEARASFKAWLRGSGSYVRWVEIEYCETTPRVTDADNFGEDE